MSFLYPSFLFALTALSIPIIVHLFNFRRYKLVYFTNVKLLKDVQQESKSKSTLKRLLILTSRLLAVACLVMAFAQPYIPGDHSVKKGIRLLSIYIDNSFSMQAVNKSGNLLEDARRKARELVQAAGASDRFQLLTNDFSSSQLSVGKEQMLEAIEKVSLSPSVKSISEVYARLRSNLRDDEKGAEFFILSDFQKSTFDHAALKPDSLHETSLVALENPLAQNVFIDSCFVESPYFQLGSTQKLHVKIKNLSDKDIENGSLKLFLNKKQVTPYSFKVAPGATTDAVLSFTCKDTGIQQGVLSIEDFPVTFDDTLYFSFRVNSRIPCLVINRRDETSGAFLQNLFKGDSLFRYDEQSDQAIDYARFQRNNLVVLNGLQTISTGLAAELKKFILAGGSALVFPARDADKDSYNNLFSQVGAALFQQADTSRLRLDSKELPRTLFEGVFEKVPENMDMPQVNFHYVEQANVRSGQEILLRLINGQPFLSFYNKGKGRLYVCSAPLDEKSSSFGRHALFVPTMIRLAILSRPAAPLYYLSGNNEAIDVSRNIIIGDKPLHIAGAGGDFIPEVKITENARFVLTHGQPAVAGNYVLMHDKQPLEGVAFNYKRKESDLSCYTKDQLGQIIRESAWKKVTLIETSAAGFKASLADISGGTKLWKLFVFLTLLFLLAETALIKFMR